MNAINVMHPPGNNARLAVVLGVSAALTVLAVLPYALSMMPAEQLAEKLAKLPPLPILVAAQVLQAALLFTLMGWIGLKLGPRVGLDAPRLRRWVYKSDLVLPPFPWRVVVLAAILSCAAIVAIGAGFERHLAEIGTALPQRPAAWKGLLASFYGGVAEELQLRLFLMTTIAWLLARFSGGRLSPMLVIGAANVIAALAFGAGHLPAASQILPLTAGAVAYIISANAIAGIVFGALYARHGLEAAIAAHFLTDIGLHVIAPLLQASA